MKHIRFPIFSRRKRLLGYWYLRKTEDGEYLVTFKYPGQDHKQRKTDDPEDAVAMFYESYLRYLARDYRQLEEELAKVPKREYVKRGFRKGWVRKLRHQLVHRKKGLISRGRKALLQKLDELRERGWPTPPLPPLPWDKIDGTKAATAAWVRKIGPESVSEPGLANQQDLQAVQRQLQQDSRDSGGSQRANPGPWDVHAAGSRSPIFQTERRGSRKLGERLEGLSITREAGKEIWGKQGEGASDRREAGDTDGQRTPDDPEIPAEKSRRRGKETEAGGEGEG